MRSVRLPALLAIATIAVPRAACAQQAGSPSAVKTFVVDVGRDYVNFLAPANLPLAIAGGVGAATVHQGDAEVAGDLAGPTPYALQPGATYGNLAFQFPLAISWWVVGHAAGTSRAAAAGRDLVRAQISGASWTYAIKYLADRTRPNGDPRSFPSGHATAAFATATVLYEHYGWKLGVPVFAAAAYVAGERVTASKHWPSDVVFGAAMGMLAGRTVTLHLRAAKIAVQPHAMRGGAGVLVHVED
jgi:membrane-associated phospholipid phosphatase